MTAKELIEELKKYPSNMDVFLNERLTEFRYGLLNSVSSKKIPFSEEDEEDHPIANHHVIILNED